MALSHLEKGSRHSVDSTKALLVIDDRSLRNEMFSNTAAIIKKIKTLQRDKTAFLSIDQHLYKEWRNIIFRKELEEAAKVRAKHKALLALSEHLQSLVETSGVSEAKAYLLLKEEQVQYQTGDQDWRYIIEQLRQSRIEHAKKKREREKAQSLHPLFIQNQDESETVEDVTIVPQLSRHQRALFYYLRELSSEDLNRHFAGSHGDKILKEAFVITMRCGDWDLLAKIWRASSREAQGFLLKKMPSHMKEFLESKIQEVQNSSPGAQSPESFSEKTLKVKDSESSPGDPELRSLYRKLARVLHPDTRSESSLFIGRQDEALELWRKIQEAYHNRDLPTLKKLDLIYTVQFGDIQSLTMDEIYESSLLFNEELEKLNASLKTYRKHPAWKFSSRRSYKTLNQRIQRELAMGLAPLLEDIERLQNRFKILDEAVETAQAVQKGMKENDRSL